MANKSNQVSSRTSPGSPAATSSNCPHFRLRHPRLLWSLTVQLVVGDEIEVRLVELEHEHEPLALVKLIHVTGVLGPAKHTNGGAYPLTPYSSEMSRAMGESTPPRRAGSLKQARARESISYFVLFSLQTPLANTTNGVVLSSSLTRRGM